MQPTSGNASMSKLDISKTSIYTLGGTVQAGDGTYIPRQADMELLQCCLSGTFAYVLTTRQMGKSSLVINTAKELSRKGIHSVIIDLTSIGVQVTPDQWYLGLVTTIANKLIPKIDSISWWNNHAHLGMAQRL